MNVLDHGYVKLIETWGSDERIVESARMSTDGAFRGWGPKCTKCDQFEDFAEPYWIAGHKHEFRPGDEKLLAYLWKNKHGTPFEMAGLTLEVQAPIFVFRQWHRHRTQSYNELSARYTAMPDLYYIPTIERIMLTGGKNKQAGGRKPVTREWSQEFASRLRNHSEAAKFDYHKALNAGIPRELARLCLPVNWYSRMRASANLRNWLGFLTLRLDDHAQWEIRQFAQAVGECVAQHFPRTWRLFNA